MCEQPKAEQSSPSRRSPCPKYIKEAQLREVSCDGSYTSANANEATVTPRQGTPACSDLRAGPIQAEPARRCALANTARRARGLARGQGLGLSEQPARNRVRKWSRSQTYIYPIELGGVWNSSPAVCVGRTHTVKKQQGRPTMREESAGGGSSSRRACVRACFVYRPKHRS